MSLTLSQLSSTIQKDDDRKMQVDETWCKCSTETMLQHFCLQMFSKSASQFCFPSKIFHKPSSYKGSTTGVTNRSNADFWPMNCHHSLLSDCRNPNDGALQSLENRRSLQHQHLISKRENFTGEKIFPERLLSIFHKEIPIVTWNAGFNPVHRHING